MYVEYVTSPAIRHTTRHTKARASRAMGRGVWVTGPPGWKPIRFWVSNVAQTLISFGSVQYDAV
jgi:hypothetical protein